MPRPKLLKLLDLLAEKRPLVVGTLLGQLSLEPQLKRAQAAPVDLLEIRLDTFPRLSSEKTGAVAVGRSVIRTLRQHSRLPLLLTLRSVREGGRWPDGGNDSLRQDVLEKLIPSVSAVDVEIRCGTLVQPITRLAHRHGVLVIHSLHDFHALPSEASLEKWRRMVRRWGGDIFKVAVTPRRESDVHKFLKWGKNARDQRLSLIAMGPLGMRTRVLGFTFGSVLTYGHLGRAAAPGQMAVRDLVASIRAIYGN